MALGYEGQHVVIQQKEILSFQRLYKLLDFISCFPPQNLITIDYKIMLTEAAVDFIFNNLLHSHPSWGLCLLERNHWINSFRCYGWEKQLAIHSSDQLMLVIKALLPFITQIFNTKRKLEHYLKCFQVLNLIKNSIWCTNYIRMKVSCFATQAALLVSSDMVKGTHSYI